MSSVRTRIAPTPSGYLHIGNLYSFVLTWLLAKKDIGHVLLRIDDMDGPRVRPEYLQDIFETLAFVELDCDEGPVNLSDFETHFSQQHRLAQYESLLADLVQTELVYGCTCSRKDIAKGKTCDCFSRKVSLNEPGIAWKIKVPEHTSIRWSDERLGPQQVYLSRVMGDFVIRRKDGLPAYQVCSVADDLHYHINMVVRGEDLLTSTAAQLWLAQLLGKNEFLNCRFLHHPLLKNEQQEKLSKSAGAGSVKAFREKGGNAAELIQRMAAMPGIEVHEPVKTLSELLELFARRNSQPLS
jgi:glutamyl/glutaminyl-tRNA synthetase